MKTFKNINSLIFDENIRESISIDLLDSTVTFFDGHSSDNVELYQIILFTPWKRKLELDKQNKQTCTRNRIQHDRPYFHSVWVFFVPWPLALVLLNLSVTVHFIFIFNMRNIRNWEEKLNGLNCGKRLLQNKSSKRIYPGTTRPVSKVNQDTIQTATIPWNINATTTGPDLVSYRCQYVT